MTHLQLQVAGRPKCRRQRKAQKVLERANQPRDPLPQGCRSPMDVHRMTATTSRFALHINKESASSRARQVRGVHVAITSATSKDVTGTSHFTCATTLTEATRNQFHRCRARTNHFLLKFSLDEVHCPKPLFKQVFQF